MTPENSAEELARATVVDRREIGRLRSRLEVLEVIHRADVDRLEDLIGDLEERIRVRE